MRRLWPRIRYLISHYILHLDDTPHRIALGVFLGCFIGSTPTIGIQVLLYFACVAVIPANKLSGLPPIWITNPLTAVPFFYMNWRLGGFLLTGRLETSSESKEAIARLVDGPPGQDKAFLERMFDAEFWYAAVDLLRSIGVELWVGSIVVGLLTGVIGYWATYYGIVAYRSRQNRAKAAARAAADAESAT